MADLLSLKKLALLGATQAPVKLSTNEFAKHINASPQTVSRRFQTLETKGLIDRKLVPDGQLISLTQKGINLLKKEFSEYRQIFAGKRVPMRLQGRVITGFGEGQYYMSLDGYVKQFVKILGFKPFPGTLNIKLEKGKLEREKLGGGFTLHGFKSHQRTYGGGHIYTARLGKIKGAVVIPDRTHYPDDIIEFIAPVNLRRKLGLRDGDKMEVRI